PVPRLRLWIVARDRHKAQEAAGKAGERLIFLTSRKRERRNSIPSLTLPARQKLPFAESTMIITVLLFAAARDMAGADPIAVELPEAATVADLRAELARRVPALAQLLAKSAIAVNQDFAEGGLFLEPTDEVA